MILTVIEQTLVLFVLLSIGFILTKAGILKDKHCRAISDMVLFAVTPAMIITELQIDFDLEHFMGILYALALAAMAFAICIVGSILLIPRSSRADYKVQRFSTVYANCGFVGFPLILGILGARGMFYVVGIAIVYNISQFTHGILSMQPDDAKKGFDPHCLLTIPIFAIVLSILMYCLQIRLPAVIEVPLEQLGSCMTPLAMLVAGNSMANMKLSKDTPWKAVLLPCFYRLIVFPVILVLICGFLPGSNLIKLVIIICMACSSGSVNIIMAVMFKRDDLLASEIFSACLILSAVTMPLIIGLATLLGITV